MDLWAELNLVGNVSYSEYLAMTDEEAVACHRALHKAVSKRGSPNNTAKAQADFEQQVARYSEGLKSGGNGFSPNLVAGPGADRFGGASLQDMFPDMSFGN